MEGRRKERDETGRVEPVVIILALVGTFGFDGKLNAILCSIHVFSALASVPYTYTHSHINIHT